MEEIKMEINVKDGMIEFRFLKNPRPIYEIIEILSKCILAFATSFMSSIPEEEQEKKKETKQHIYDLMNLAFSNTLALFAPEIELRPDLTSMAIKEMEDKIIKEGRAPALEIPEEYEEKYKGGKPH